MFNPSNNENDSQLKILTSFSNREFFAGAWPAVSSRQSTTTGANFETSPLGLSRPVWHLGVYVRAVLHEKIFPFGRGVKRARS